MCATLKIENTAPPGSWRYMQPETRLWFTNYTTAEDTAWAIVQHRHYKQLPRATYVEALADMYHQLCERLGPAYCNGIEEGVKDLSQNLDAEQAMAFTGAALQFVASGAKLENIEEASRRAEICRGCHLNMPVSTCVGCSALKRWVESILPNDRKFSDLGICARCGCGLKAKVNCPPDVVKASDNGRNLKYPDYCWVKQL